MRDMRRVSARRCATVWEGTRQVSDFPVTLYGSIEFYFRVSLRRILGFPLGGLMTVLDLSYNFASLSVRDLLDARDTYHYHLLSKANVIGTAVGLYLIRKDEEWPQRRGE